MSLIRRLDDLMTISKAINEAHLIVIIPKRKTMYVWVKGEFRDKRVEGDKTLPNGVRVFKVRLSI